MKALTLFFLFIFFSLTFVATGNAQIPGIISSYRFYKDIIPTINVPTVVEVPFANDSIERFDFAVFNNNTSSFEPYFFIDNRLDTSLAISSNPINSSINNAVDNNTNTYADFPLPENLQGVAQVTLQSTRPITSSSLTTLLDANVALPNYIEIRAMVQGQNTIVVANQQMNQQTIYFPKTISNTWIITYTFSQPLRVSELQLHQDNVTKDSARAVRFLAQPNQSYRLYFDPDRLTTPPVAEAGNLSLAKDVSILPQTTSINNPNYTIADVDNDNIADLRDNCVDVANTDQKDINNNGRGDVCDDFDQDGVTNNKDNCQNMPNINQTDTDGDQIGDACDNQESRLTERYQFLPWAGIGFAALVLIALFALTAKSSLKR